MVKGKFALENPSGKRPSAASAMSVAKPATGLYLTIRWMRHSVESYNCDLICFN